MKRLLLILLPLSVFGQTYPPWVTQATIDAERAQIKAIIAWDSCLTAKVNTTALSVYSTTAQANALYQAAGTYATGTGSAINANTGDNAANTTYANDFRAANFVAGTNYLAPAGNGSALTGLTKGQVGLSSADNTSDASKPVSTAQATAIALKSSIYVGIDAGANDSYVITASPAPGSYTVGMVVILKANTANTGAASVNVNGLGVKTIVKRVSTALANGDIPALSYKMLIYDGTNFTLLNPVVN